MIKIVYGEITVHTRQGYDHHWNSGMTTRNDELVIHDASGITRKVYAKGYWSNAEMVGERKTIKVNR